MRLQTKLFLIAAIPLAVVLILSTISVVEQVKKRTDEQLLAESLTAATNVSALIHELQKERGYTASHVGSKGSVFADEVQRQRKETDAALKAARGALAAASTKNADDVSDFNKAASKLAAMRAQADRLEGAAARYAAFYTGAITNLMHIVEHAVHSAFDPDVKAAAEVYLGVFEGKENAGLERAMGGIGFGSGGFSIPIYSRFVAYGSAEETFLAASLLSSNADAAAIVAKALEDDMHAEVKRMRKVALSSFETGDLQGVDGTAWFAAATAWIEELRAAEIALKALMLSIVEAKVSEATTGIILQALLSIMAATVSIGAAYVIAGGLQREVQALSGELRRIADDDLDRDAEVQLKTSEFSSIGDMARVFLDNGLRRRQADEAAAEAAAEVDRARAAAKAADEAEAAASAAAAKAAEAQRAEADARQKEQAEAERAELEAESQRKEEAQRVAEEMAAKDAQKALADRERAQSLSVVVSSLSDGLKALADGELTYQIDVPFNSEYEELRANFNSAIAKLCNTMQAITQKSHGINGGATQISQSADDLATRTERQAGSLEETAAAIEEMTASVQSATERAEIAEKSTRRARGDAEAGEEVIEQTVTAMGEIDTSSGKISEIISVIDDIAFQTNLLALNAGVEAARAGEAGRGFAVVASEVRGLAQRCSDAAREIKTLISESGEQVKRGVDLVGKTGEALRKINVSVVEISDHVSSIFTSSKEQAIGLDEINSTVAQLDQVTQQNAAMVEESTAASHELTSEASDLIGLVGVFSLSTDALERAMNQRHDVAKPEVPASKIPSGARATSLATAAAVESEEEWTEF